MIPTMNCWANGHGLPLLLHDRWTYMHSLYKYTMYVHTHIPDFQYIHHVFPSISMRFYFSVYTCWVSIL